MENKYQKCPECGCDEFIKDEVTKFHFKMTNRGDEVIVSEEYEGQSGILCYGCWEQYTIVNNKLIPKGE